MCLPDIGEVVSVKALKGLTATILRSAGLREDDARKMADVLVFAQESGINSHGVAHLPAYVGGIRSGALKAQPQMAVESRAAGACVIDAAGAPGALAGIRACEELMARARANGVAAVAVRNSAHFGAASAFVSLLAEEGLVALAFSNASATVAPRGARTALFGTNPIAAGLPRADAPPVVIDFATTVGARGKIRKAAKEGQPIPADWALDADGQPTTDATAALSGTMQALGGFKGTVLPMLVELLVVALSGGNAGLEVLPPQEGSDRCRGVSHLFIAFDAAAFGGQAGVAAKVAELSALVEGAEPSDPSAPPRMPGARGASARAEAAQSGIPMTSGLHAALREAAELTGISCLEKS